MKIQQKQLYIVIGIMVVAVAAVVILISNSGRTPLVQVDYMAIPQSRTSDGAFTLGDPNAPVTIIEFADFACPHCQEYRPEIERFIQDYVATGRARFEFRMFPTAGGQQTVFADKLAECAEALKPGGFWDAYNVLYEIGATGDYFSDDLGRNLAQRIGISSYSQLLACSEAAAQVNIDSAFGDANGVTGTPAVMVRYNNGAAQWVSYNGSTYDSFAPPYDVLAGVVETNS